MQRRKTALATMVMTAIARWNRLTTLKVWEDSEAIAAEGCAWKPNADRLSTAAAESGFTPGRRPIPNRSTRSGAPSMAARSGRCSRTRSAPREISAGSGRGS